HAQALGRKVLEGIAKLIAKVNELQMELNRLRTANPSSWNRARISSPIPYRTMAPGKLLVWDPPPFDRSRRSSSCQSLNRCTELMYFRKKGWRIHSGTEAGSQSAGAK